MSGDLRQLARAEGFELVPRRKLRLPYAQLVHTLHLFEVDLVIDGGANLGQYARILREEGWTGPILSIEPIPEVHARLAEQAAADPLWHVLPPLALGARDGTATLEVSAESDMSSLLPQNDTLHELSPTAAVRERIEVPLRRLDGLDLPVDARRPFLKLDLQGGEAAALAGAAGLLPRLVGLQVEMALVTLYAGETPWREMVAGLEAEGFALHLLIPGYYERKLGRQLQVDGVFYREKNGLPPAPPGLPSPGS